MNISIVIYKMEKIYIHKNETWIKSFKFINPVKMLLEITCLAIYKIEIVQAYLHI